MTKVLFNFARFKAKAKSVRAKTAIALCDQSGQGLVEHAGWIAVIVLIIGVVIVFALPSLRNTILPAIQSTVMKIFNFNG
jgi:hypothetical protein